MTDIDDFDSPRFGSGDAPVTTFMGEEPVLVAATTTLREAAIALQEAGVGLLVVGERSRVEGVVSERDIVRAVAEGTDLDATTVADVETRDLFWATEDSTVGDVVEEMMEDYVRHILIGDNTGLVGIVSMRDVLAAYLE